MCDCTELSWFSGFSNQDSVSSIQFIQVLATDISYTNSMFETPNDIKALSMMFLLAWIFPRTPPWPLPIRSLLLFRYHLLPALPIHGLLARWWSTSKSIHVCCGSVHKFWGGFIFFDSILVECLKDVLETLMSQPSPASVLTLCSCQAFVFTGR